MTANQNALLLLSEYHKEFTEDASLHTAIQISLYISSNGGTSSSYFVYSLQTSIMIILTYVVTSSHAGEKLMSLMRKLAQRPYG